MILFLRHEIGDEEHEGNKHDGEYQFLGHGISYIKTVFNVLSLYLFL